MEFIIFSVLLLQLLLLPLHITTTTATTSLSTIADYNQIKTVRP